MKILLIIIMCFCDYGFDTVDLETKEVTCEGRLVGYVNYNKKTKLYSYKSDVGVFHFQKRYNRFHKNVLYLIDWKGEISEIFVETDKNIYELWD